MVEWVGQRSSGGEVRGVGPAGRPLPAGQTMMPVPPPFLVYKRRLYVLARKAPTLDHKQAGIDEIFGEPKAANPLPRARPKAPVIRVAYRPAAANQLPSAGRAAGQVRRIALATTPKPRFVPRKRLAEMV